MKPEIIIKNWLMAWFKPEKVTEHNTKPRRPLEESNFGEFIKIFKNERNEDEFTEDEKKTLKEIILKPLQFGTGYPRNTKEVIQLGSIYIIGGGWQQTTTYVGSNRWDGRASSHIAITGLSTGDDLNMTEPSLLLNAITSLLISGHNYFTYHHMTNPVIAETLYSADEKNSYEQKIAMRTLSLSYESDRHGVVTHDPKK